MKKKQKKTLIRIIISIVFLVALNFIPVTGWLRLVLFLVPYFIVGCDILWKAVLGIKNLQPLDECFLMVVATLGAFAIAIWEGNGDYNEAVAVMLFYQIGEWFQSYAVRKSRKNITELMDIRPDFANVEKEGRIEQADPDEVEVGTVIIVRPGEKIPIDGIVEEGESELDTAALTGESLPRYASAGCEVISGCINMTGLLKIRTTKEFGESTVSKILDMMENASSRKSRSEDFISKFARIYTPVVCALAVALAVLPPLFNIIILKAPGAWNDWIYRALTFLVISCPCALVISIPLSFFAGIGGASHEGVLVKGSNYLETLSKVNAIVFDKTGTLTKGSFEVSGIYAAGISKEELLRYAALAESSSTHPIARSIVKAYGKEPDIDSVKNLQEISGHGVKAMIDGREIAVGNGKLMKLEGAEITENPGNTAGSVIYVSIDRKFAGSLVISDRLKENSGAAIKALKEMGISDIALLTGDGEAAARAVAAELGIDNVYARLLPGDKVDKLEEMLKDNSKKLAFAGDGINDAPVLSRADVGIAMGALGSDAAIEAADIVLMDDDPLKIPRAVRIARKCMRIVYENIYFAIGIKVICLILGALGIANMWIAIFADVGVMVLCVLNAIRALRAK